MKLEDGSSNLQKSERPHDDPSATPTPCLPNTASPTRHLARVHIVIDLRQIFELLDDKLAPNFTHRGELDG